MQIDFEAGVGSHSGENGIAIRFEAQAELNSYSSGG
jgi:hypothetical protein